VLLRSVAVVAALLAVPAAGHAKPPSPDGRLVFMQSTLTAELSGEGWFFCTSDPDGSSASRISEPGYTLVGQPAISPDGSLLAFMEAVPQSERALVVTTAAGQDRRVLRVETHHANSPTWAPDGRSLVYVLDHDLRAVSWPDGSVRQITSTPGRLEFNPVVSPDGTRIAYAAATGTHVPHDLVVADADGDSPRILASFPELAQPDWAPDGSRIAFQGGGRIRTVAPDGSGLADLGPGGQPAWSPDGTRIAFYRDGDIWTMTADGSDARQVTRTPPLEHSPVWQPATAAIRAEGTRGCVRTGTAGDDILEGTPWPDFFYDGPGDDVIRGAGGNDLVVDGPGADDVNLGDGDDKILLKSGANVIYAGAGADQVWRAGVPRQAQTIDGGGGDDELAGAAAADLILGGPGDDSIAGWTGADRIFGGTGRDRIQGMNGDDRIEGGAGHDWLEGGPGLGAGVIDGHDLLLGGPGDDRLEGGRQDDRLLGGPGRDRLHGGPGRDRISGGPGRDWARRDASDRVDGVERRTR
jgi:Ca2+-binding RTX toxin-like protein